MSTVMVRSLYGATHRRPLVALHWQDTVVQLSPTQARKISSMLLECAEAAEQDAFLFEWSQQTVGCTEESAARLIEAFREWRGRRMDTRDSEGDGHGDG